MVAVFEFELNSFILGAMFGALALAIIISIRDRQARNAASTRGTSTNRARSLVDSVHADSDAVWIQNTRYGRFTDRARKVMKLATEEAWRFHHEYIGTEHILLGLVKKGSGVAAKVLADFDIDLRKIRFEVEKIIQTGPGGEGVVFGNLPLTPRTKSVIELATEEASSLNHNYVGTEHLLLGLLRETEGVAAQVLINLGLKFDDVRKATMNLLGLPYPESTAPGSAEG